MEITKHEPGAFSWADLATPDLAASKAFYGQLLGLDAAVDMPAGGDAVYAMLRKSGRDVCGLYGMAPELRQATGGRAVWQSYFTVERADEVPARVRALGGAVVREPFDVMESGRMTVARDATGAVFAVWEPRRAIGAQVWGEPGALSWTELYTRDTEAAAKFYAGLFGWSAHASGGGDGAEYTEFRNGGRPTAGMMAIRPEWGEMPPNWSVYFAVADLEAALGRAAGLDAKTIVPPTEVAGVGRFAFLQDPQGAAVAVIQLVPAGAAEPR